jgi:hypothetical protein
MSEFGETISMTIRGLAASFAENLPNFLGALLIVLAGWLVARIVRALTRQGMRLLDKLSGRVVGSYRLGIGRSADMVGAIAYWIVLLLFVTAATQVLGLTAFTDWLARLIEYLPTFIAGLLIIVAGYLFSRFVSELVYSAAHRLGSAQRGALARIAQTATLLAAVLVGADQIGIEVTWIAILTAVVIASLLGGVTIALSLGARVYVSNLIGAHYLRQAFEIGQRVRVAGFEGRILDVTATSLVLETTEGRVALPARLYNEEPILLITRASDG